MQPPGRVYQQCIAARLLGCCAGVPADTDRIHFRCCLKNRSGQPVPEFLELFDRRRSIDVGGHQIGLASQLVYMYGKFSGRCGFTGALQADQH